MFDSLLKDQLISSISAMDDRACAVGCEADKVDSASWHVKLRYEYGCGHWRKEGREEGFFVGLMRG
jgi:hypothetical protein